MSFSIFKGSKPAQDAAERLDRASPGDSLRSIFAGCDDKTWLWVLTEGRESDDRIRALLPELPSEEVQINFTGRSNRLAFEQAISAIETCMEEAGALGLEVGDPGVAVLDLGCGWGRLTQTLLRHFDPAQITGGDVAPRAIELCQQLGVPGRIVQMPHLPPTELPGESFDLIIGFSVFSHLAEEVHLAWVEELARLLRPGGVLAVTTRPRAFFKYTRQLRDQVKEGSKQFPGAARAFVDTEDWLARYDRGEFCFDAPHMTPAWPGVYYGEAAVPEQFVRKHWGAYFDRIRFLPAEKQPRLDQSLITAAKPR